MSKRKTIDISKLKRMANDYFYHTGDAFVAERKAIADFLSAILMDVDAYKGFGYLTKSQSKEGHSIGLIIDYANPANNQFPDDSRVIFY